MTTACDIVNTLRFHFCTFFHTFSYDFDEFFFIADSAYCTAFAYMFYFHQFHKEFFSAEPVDTFSFMSNGYATGCYTSSLR